MTSQRESDVGSRAVPGQSNAPFRPRHREGATLPVHRAFVVHFATGGGPRRRRFRGRVEHLPSGRATQFSSLTALLAFFVDVLDGAPPRPERP